MKAILFCLVVLFALFASSEATGFLKPRGNHGNHGNSHGAVSGVRGIKASSVNDGNKNCLYFWDCSDEACEYVTKCFN